MSSAALYAFPSPLTEPVQQTRRCGRFPKNVLNLQRIRCERNDKRSLEQARRAAENNRLRRDVFNALTDLATKVSTNGMIGMVVCAVDADREPLCWGAGLCNQDRDAAREVMREVLGRL